MVKEGEKKEDKKEEGRVSSLFGYVSPTKLFGRKDTGAGKGDATHTLAAAVLPSAASK
jgi:hypothetical protein